MRMLNNGSRIESAISRVGNGIFNEIGLTIDRRYGYVDREFQLLTFSRYFRNFQTGPKPQKPTPQTAPTGNIGQNVAGLLTGGCGEFVQKLYKQAAGMYPYMELRSQTFNLLDVFNTINSRPGAIVIEPVVVDGRPGGGTISGRMGDTANPATIHISPITYYNVLPASGRHFAEYSYAMTAIHETFHLAGYNDYGLAQAVHKLTGAPGLPKDGADSFAFSRYWNDVLSSKCPEPKRP